MNYHYEENEKKISVAVIRRLPRYFRYLRGLIEQGITRVSSAELARMMEVTASQIRQDLNCFGGFGQQGYGYNVEHLYDQICELLGVKDNYRAVIIGAGNLGRAIVRSPMFERRGVTPVAMFDISEDIVGNTVGNIPVYHMKDLETFCRVHKVDIGILVLPKDQAEGALTVLEKAGVRGIWNFTSAELNTENEETLVENVHLGDSLMTLCYRLRSNGVFGDTENSKTED
ncbi:MAG: redox-sensing transcriptional repressor Rex [Clostridia bacterium]|nr:redox-sensing transcriptional repressor Rex [Clostridia bacterium]